MQPNIKSNFTNFGDRVSQKNKWDSQNSTGYLKIYYAK